MAMGVLLGSNGSPYLAHSIVPMHAHMDYLTSMLWQMRISTAHLHPHSKALVWCMVHTWLC